MVTRMQTRNNLFSRVRSRIPLYKEDFSKDVKEFGFLKALFLFLKRILHFFINRINPSAIRDVQYVKWMENIESEYLNKESMLQEYSKLESKPKFSIIFPVWNTEREILKKALDSVTEQIYENWEICISDGSSEKREETQKFLKSFQKEYPDKVKLCSLSDILRRGVNIVDNSNNAISISTGQYILFMDCDDKLSPNCLLELAKGIEENPDVEFLYSDFDKIDENGRRFAPSFWPDFSPHLLTSQMYTVHVTCYRKDILNELNGLREGTDGAQDWDLVLRYMILRKCKDFKNVLHIPKVLYHWRVLEGSVALSGKEAKSWAYERQKDVLEEYLVRRRMEGEVVEGFYDGSWRVRYAIVGNPKVSIVIPFKDKIELLKKAIPSILEKTKYNNYEIVLVDNQSKEEETFKYLDEISKEKRVRIIKYDNPYHFGKIYNWAVEQIDSEYMLMLNNDIEVLSDEWLISMLELCQLPEVGMVGGRLYYPDGRIQHAGVVFGLGNSAGHAYRTLPGHTHGFDSPVVNIKNYLSITCACAMIKTELFKEIGKFDEELEPVLQDVDLGIRLYDSGYFNVYTPYTELIHYESVSRLKKGMVSDSKEDEKCANIIKNKWPEYFKRDPFYNINLSNKHEDFRIKTDNGESN
ncbi:MAG: glycosyltransferase family 2 protein [Candidatus Dojkabacteria bacterium]